MSEMLVTREQALALVRKSDREKGRWCVQIRLDAPIEGKPDKCFPDGLASYIDLSRAQASKLISSMLSDVLEERGARIRIFKSEGYGGPVYWIGQ